MKTSLPRKFARFSVIPLVLVAGVAVTLSLSAAEKADESKTGLAVGEQAPDFSLPDQSGEMHTLSEMLKEGPIAVVFTRSAEW